MSRRSRLWVLLGGALAVSGTAALSQQPREKSLPAVIAKDQEETCRNALAALQQLVTSKTVPAGDPRIDIWSRRRIEALRAMKAPKNELIAALETHLERAKAAEALARQAQRAGGVAQINLFEAQYRRQEAELWLAQEKSE